MRTRTRSCRWSVGACSLLVALMLLGLAHPRLSTPAAAQATVKMGYLPVISYVAVFAADTKGFFKEAGVKVEFTRFQSGGKMVLPLANGQIDVASGSATAGFFNSINRGMDFKITADKGQVRPGFGYTALVARQDLYDSGAVRKIADLRGKRISNSSKGNIISYFLGNMLESAGMSLRDVQEVYLRFPQHLPALMNKSLDLAFTVEPWAARMKLAGVGTVLFTPDQFSFGKSVQVAMIMYSGKFIRDKRDAAQKYMNAYVKAIKWYNKRGMKNPEVLAVLKKWTKVPEKAITTAIPMYLDNDGRVNVESLKTVQKWYVKAGFLSQEVAMSKAVDESFLK